MSHIVGIYKLWDSETVIRLENPTVIGFPEGVSHKDIVGHPLKGPGFLITLHPLTPYPIAWLSSQRSITKEVHLLSR